MPLLTVSSGLKKAVWNDINVAGSSHHARDEFVQDHLRRMSQTAFAAHASIVCDTKHRSYLGEKAGRA
jgi:hypothetical protein